MERRLKGGGHELCAKGMNTNSHFQFSNRLAFFSFHLTACSPEAASMQQASLGSSKIAGEQWCEQKYRGSVLHTSCHISAARTGCLMIQPTVWTRENPKKLLCFLYPTAIWTVGVFLYKKPTKKPPKSKVFKFFPIGILRYFKWHLLWATKKLTISQQDIIIILKQFLHWIWNQDLI